MHPGSHTPKTRRTAPDARLTGRWSRHPGARRGCAAGRARTGGDGRVYPAAALLHPSRTVDDLSASSYCFAVVPTFGGLHPAQSMAAWKRTLKEIPRVARAGGEPLVNHRSPRFKSQPPPQRRTGTGGPRVLLEPRGSRRRGWRVSLEIIVWRYKDA